MKRYLLHAYENIYGGLHGIEDYTVVDIPDDWDEDYVYEQYIPEMSEQVMYSFGDIIDSLADPEDYDSEEEFERDLSFAITENTGGYVAQVRDNVEESTEELDEILCRLGAKLFCEKYCVN